MRARIIAAEHCSACLRYLERQMEAAGRKAEHFDEATLKSITREASRCIDAWGCISVESLTAHLEQQMICFAAEKAAKACLLLVQMGLAESRGDVLVRPDHDREIQ